MGLGFPPFTFAVKWLVIANGVVYLLMSLAHVAAPTIYAYAYGGGGLVPAAVVHGWIWQVVTYSFLHAGLFHLLFNMLALWMFGATLESDWGTRQFLEFYFFCVIGAALCTIAISYTGVMGVSPMTMTVGSSGGVYGILLAFGMLYGDRELMLFPLPFLIKAKYMVIGIIFIALVGAMQGGGGVAYFAHLGGLLFGFLYIKFLPRRGLMFAGSESAYGIRNSYYRWKRRRAAKKFEVYMRKHDRKEFFDEYGNYRPPEDKGNGESRRPPWVN